MAPPPPPSNQPVTIGERAQPGGSDGHYAQRVSLGHTVFSVPWVLAVGQASLALTIAILDVIAVILSAFSIVRFFVFVSPLMARPGMADLLLFSCMLLAAAVVRSPFLTTYITTYFGFLNYYIGSGSLLIICGTFSLGIYSTWGQVVGAVAIAWGVIEIVAHFALPKVSPATLGR